MPDGVVSPEGQSLIDGAARLFQKARVDADAAAAQGANPSEVMAGMKPIRSNIGCPECLAQGNGDVPLTNFPGQTRLTCGRGHFYGSDQIESDGKGGMALRIDEPGPNDSIRSRFIPLKKLAVSQTNKPTAPPEGSIPVQLMVRPEVVNALKAKYGDRLSATLAGALRDLSQPSGFLFPATDVERVSQLLNEKVADAGKLFGLIFALKQQRDEATEEAEKLRALKPSGVSQASTAPGSVAIKLSDAALAKMTEKATFNNQSPAEYIAGVIEYAVTQGWV